MASTPVSSVAGSRGTAQVHRGVFSREGEFWRIAYDDQSFLLRQSKGLAYIAQLLRFPGTEFHALDLVGGNVSVASDPDDISFRARSSLPYNDDALASAGIHVGGLGDAGEMLDEQAKAQYRRRLAELRDELEEAKTLGNIDRAEAAETEIQSLTAELSRAVGLGGRNRRAASASERARQSVTHAMKSAIEKVGENSTQLGALFSRCIKTGGICAYFPDPATSVAWEFGSTGDQRQASFQATSGVEGESFDSPGLKALRATAAFSSTTKSLTQMAGREAELAQLGSLAERAVSGNGAIVLLGGGPGVGKTRLSLEVGAQASRRDFVCLSGRCYERDEPHPLMPFVEIIEAVMAQASSVEHFRTLLSGNAGELAQIAPTLRRVFPDLPAPPELPTAQVRRYLFQSLFDFITRIAGARPLLLLLDDLHWADESTLAMLNFLARRIEHVPVLVLAAYRDEELDAPRPLTRTLEELLRLGIHPIKLRGLPRGAVAQMLASLSHRQPPEQLVSLIFEETQGNPFFVEEVFSHLVEEGKIFDEAGDFRQSSDTDVLTVPDNVRLVLDRRLGRLSDNAREVLSLASVIGRSFSFMLLEAVLDRAAPEALFDGLEEAQRAGFITSSAQGPEAPFAFSHELVRQTLLGGISLPRQQRLHLKIAQALEKLYSTRIEERAAEVAHHVLKSGPFTDEEKAANYLSLAGRSSLRAGALEDARRSLAAALTYKQTDAAQRAQTLADLACAERGLGDWGAAMAHLQDSLGLYARVGNLRSIGRIFFEMVESFIWTGHFDEAVAITAGLTHLRGDESDYRARLLTASGLIDAVRGEFSPAIKAFDEALDFPTATPFRGRIFAYRSVCNFYFLRLHEALEDSRRSAALTNAQESPWTHAIALARTMLSAYHLRNPDQALRVGIELEPLARSIGQLAALSYCVSITAWAEFGREPDLSLLDQRIQNDVNVNRGARLSLFLTGSLAQLSMVRFLRGNWDSARLLAEEAHAAELPGVFRSLGVAMLLRLAAYSGDRDRVSELVEQTESQLPLPGRANTIGAWSLLIGMVESLAMVGERARAGELYPRVRELLGCGAVCISFACRFVQTIAGIAAAAANQWDAAEQHFGVALRQASELPHRLEEAELRRFHAMMLLWRDLTGDRARAREILIPAVESYERIGMPRHLKLARALLAEVAQ